MDWGELLSLLSTGDGLPPFASDPSALPDAPGRRHHGSPRIAPGARRRRKQRTGRQELDELRSEVAQLSLDLETRKRAAGIDPHAPVARVRGSNAVATAPGVRTPLWQKLALQQKELRCASEDENRALRAAFAAQARHAGQLRRLLARQAKDEFARVTALLRVPRPLTSAGHSSSDDSVLQILAAGMESEYLRVDESFRTAGMDTLPRPGRSWTAQVLEADKWSVRLRDVHILPFERAAAERAVWIQVTNAPDCEAKEARASFPFQVGQAELQQYTVARQHRDRRRTVLVLREMTLPRADFSIRSTRLVVIRSEASASPDEPRTAVETLSVAVCSIEGQQAGTYFEDVSRWEDSFSQVQKDIENRLVAESVRK